MFVMPRAPASIPTFPAVVLFGPMPGPGVVDCRADACLDPCVGLFVDFTTNRTCGVVDRLGDRYGSELILWVGPYPTPVPGALAPAVLRSVTKRIRFHCVCSACIAASNNSFILDDSGV